MLAAAKELQLNLLRRLRFLALGIVLCFICPPPTVAQLSTEDHVADPGFWPTQPSGPQKLYTGGAACASCHAGITSSQLATPMANAALFTRASGILNSHPALKFTFGRYQYQFQTDAKQTLYSISDGEKHLQYPLLWAFGIGRVGQSYLFKKDDGNFYEARVTYFQPLKTLDFTPGRALTAAKDIDEAMYRKVGAGEIIKCFACHTTGSAFEGQFNEATLAPGVHCEACHGPGAQHVAVQQAAKLSGIAEPGAATIFNAAQLKPADSVDFCGACHATFWDVKLAGGSGPSTARSQPYRLVQSKCWGQGDARLTCIACHDPHKQLETDSAAYDGACLKCHVNSASAKKTAEHPGPACPVATQNCASCHMAKVYVPEMHADFTDHRIRIVRAGQAYPE